MIGTILETPLLIVIPLLSAATGFIFALAIKKFAYKLGLVDIPNIRSAHSQPTPGGGGMGIPIAAGLVTFVWAGSMHWMVGLALFLSAFSFIDDIKELPVRVRFLTQLGVALALVWVCKKEYIVLLDREWGVAAVIVFFLFTAAFITATTNFFNFMDGINGISGSMSIISFGLLGVYAFYFKGDPYLPILSIAVVFSSLGFLALNFHRARVFMGDVGSIFIGNLFAAVAVWQARSIKEFLLLLSFQSTLYIDCISTIILRLWDKENILKAHKRHLYQRFVHRLKWSHTRVTLLYSAVQLLAGLFAILFFKYSIFYLLGLWLLLISVYWFIRVKMNFISNDDL
jgi:Fuc2NAc and GlcNAc transferase